MIHLLRLVTSQGLAFEPVESYRCYCLELYVEMKHFNSSDSCYFCFDCPSDAICSSSRWPDIFIVNPYLSGRIHPVLGVIGHLYPVSEIYFIIQLFIYYLVSNLFGLHKGLHSEIWTIMFSQVNFLSQYPAWAFHSL